MGSRGAGGGKAGSGVQRGVPSSGRGGQAREGFPGREDGGQHSGQREGWAWDWYLVQPVSLGRFLHISET